MAFGVWIDVQDEETERAAVLDAPWVLAVQLPDAVHREACSLRVEHERAVIGGRGYRGETGVRLGHGDRREHRAGGRRPDLSGGLYDTGLAGRGGQGDVVRRETGQAGRGGRGGRGGRPGPA